ncbi:MAG TPA: asparagine synthase (glutamine-hydrolyzing) [Burkholderiaceae bacterium]|nr:asparagine synthase (glutamine-hydrolyzing) [Burkholderiaceae bacterium]
MCGIHGLYQLDGSPAPVEWLARMGDVTVHRGPDDAGVHADGRCAIGMRRLSIIDLAGGHQPLANHDRSLVVVCNGEIYNYRELRRELQGHGHRFGTESDSEVVLHGYAQWGERFVERLNGMFGFAIWDSPRQTLLVGRDRLGIKPIYWAENARRVSFASEAKALLELPGFEREVDAEALAAYLELGYVPAPLSIFRGIRKLPIGSILKVSPGGTSVHTYWQPSTRVDPAVSATEWTHRVRDRLEQSVRMQMVSDVPIGAFLSGGIDSSAVLAFMARHSSSPVKTYSIGFDGGAAERFYNELDHARQVATLFNTDHHEILVKPDVVRLLPKLLWHMDEPIADSAFVTTFLVAEFARRDVKVILSGVGGDELFGGYRRYLGEHYMRYVDWLPQPAKRTAARLAGWLPSDRHSKWMNYSRLAKSFLGSAASPFTDRYRAYVGVFSAAEASALMRRAPQRRMDAIADSFDRLGGDDALARMFAVDASTQLPDDLLLLTDKMTMASSLECRVPLLDHELVELAAQIPASVKVAGGELKALMKKALADVLPREVLYRPKRGFGAPMGAWLKGALSEMLGSALSPQSLERRGLLNAQPVARLIEDHQANRVDGTDKLLALLNFEVWCRVYLDGRASSDVADELEEAVA